jgi:hypothetical protein
LRVQTINPPVTFVLSARLCFYGRCSERLIFSLARSLHPWEPPLISLPLLHYSEFDSRVNTLFPFQSVHFHLSHAFMNPILVLEWAQRRFQDNIGEAVTLRLPRPPHHFVFFSRALPTPVSLVQQYKIVVCPGD